MSIKQLLCGCSLVLALALAGVPAQAASSGNTSTTTNVPVASPEYDKAVKMTEDGDFNGAIALLNNLVNADPTDADANNMLGFSHRKLGDTDKAFAYYNAALEIKPDHVGANEYIGELYLELGDLTNAEKHLKVLDAACFFGCAEYTDLKTAIKKYKAQLGG